MATSIKPTDNLYWDLSSVSLRNYEQNSEGTAYVATDHRNVEDDWVQIDTGGFRTTGSTRSQPYWEVARNSARMVNADSAASSATTPMNVTFGVPFADVPAVCICQDFAAASNDNGKIVC